MSSPSPSLWKIAFVLVFLCSKAVTKAAPVSLFKRRTAKTPLFGAVYVNKARFSIAEFVPPKHVVLHTIIFVLASELLCKIGSAKKQRAVQRSHRHRQQDGSYEYRYSYTTKTIVNPEDGDRYANFLIGINLLVFGAWRIATELEPTFLLRSTELEQRSKKMVRWMETHFTESSNVKRRRLYPHSTLLSTFSHQSWQHFFGNMYAITSFIPGIVRILGNRKFSYFYISSAYGSNWIGNWITERFSGNGRSGSGASGILSSMMAYYCLSFPKAEIAYGSPIGLSVGVKAPVAALAWLLQEMIDLEGSDGIGHGVHRGGFAFGAAVWAFGILWKHWVLPIKTVMKNLKAKVKAKRERKKEQQARKQEQKKEQKTRKQERKKEQQTRKQEKAPNEKTFGNNYEDISYEDGFQAVTDVEDNEEDDEDGFQDVTDVEDYCEDYDEDGFQVVTDADDDYEEEDDEDAIDLDEYLARRSRGQFRPGY